MIIREIFKNRNKSIYKKLINNFKITMKMTNIIKKIIFKTSNFNRMIMKIIIKINITIMNSNSKNNSKDMKNKYNKINKLTNLLYMKS